ncbi:MAG: S1 family peptidase [Deltaproteobacteria bacterium]
MVPRNTVHGRNEHFAIAVSFAGIVCAASWGCEGVLEVGQRPESILRGDADIGPERFPGVVLVQAPPSSCSGTLIAVQGSIGWVLTAGHCVIGPDLFLRAPNYITAIMVGADRAAQRRFTATGVYLHPRYTIDRLPVSGSLDPQLRGVSYDLALVSFSGADASLAPYVIPLLAPAEDSLTVGSPLEVAGFGYTAASGPAALVRRAAPTNIAEIITTPQSGAQFFVIDQRGSNAGICFGDSGGPAVVTLGDGARRVAGVLSFVTATDDVPCTEFGGIQRVSTELEAFVRPVLAGLPLPEPTTCLTCTFARTQSGTHCFDVLASALGSNASGYQECLRHSDEASCRASFAAGAAGFDAFWRCIQTEACATQCPPAERAYFECHEDLDGVGPCTRCTFGTHECCDLEARCSLDATCAPCLTRVDQPTACATHPLFRETYACVHAHCAAECDPYFRYAGSPPDGGIGADAARDASSIPDAGAEAAGVTTLGGCGCTTPSGRNAGGRQGSLALVAVLAWGSRRRTQRALRASTAHASRGRPQRSRR